MEEQLAIQKAQNELIIKKLDIIIDTMDRRFQEWSDDRKTLTNIETQGKVVEAKVEGARDDIQDQTKKVINRVQENLQPMPDIVANAVSEAVKKKKGLFK